MTKFYLSNYTAYNPMPNVSQSSESVEQAFTFYLGDRDTLPTIYPLMMFTESKNADVLFGQSFYESVSNHQGWIKTWVSPPLEYSVMTNVTGSFRSALGVDPVDRTIIKMYPILHIYVWSASDVKGPTLYYATSSVYADYMFQGSINSYNTFPNITLSAGTVSDGDRLCLELMWFDPDADGLKHTHYIAFNGDPTTRKNYCMLSLSSNLNFMDSVFLENDTVRRGRNSLVMYPRTTLPEPPASPTISTPRWINNRSSVNEYHMIDDFERYTNSSDMSSEWYTYGYGTSYKWARYIFDSVMDFSDYDAFTFYARAAPATVLSFKMRDENEVYTNAASFSVSNIWERYEATISWGSANPNQIRYVYFSTSYFSDIRIDDVALLKFGADEINETWLEMDVTDYGYSRDMKFNEVKIPYKSGKEVQFSGERNAKGTIEIHDVLNKNKNFLYEKMQSEIPLYFRHRNHGLPMNIIELSPNYKNIGYNNVSTMLSVKFSEIYDDTMR